MKIGITGTQEGTTIEQITSLETFLASLARMSATIVEVHHGDCIGADDEVSTLIKERFPSARIITHPPADPSKRAFQKNVDLEYPPRPYLERNKDIVNHSKTILAFPKTEEEILRSGTWATIRYARKQRKEVIIFCPLGNVVVNSFKC